MSTESDRFNRLPKWAQEEIKHLELRLKEANEQIAKDRTPVTDQSRIIVDPWGDKQRHLDARASVRFNLLDEGDIDARLTHLAVYDKVKRVYTKVPALDINFSGRMSSGLSIHPMAGNSIIVTAGR